MRVLNPAATSLIVNDSSTQPTAKNTFSLNKSLVTSVCALLLTVLAFFLEEPLRAMILNVGLFALSGALTNWLAIHMLFEKVPGFYGSGVIPARFQDFKQGIHELMMKQFFTKENLTRFFGGSSGSTQLKVNLAPLIDSVDLAPSFEALKTAVMKSQFGGTLAMFGGAAALDPIQPDFVNEMRASVKGIVASEDFQEKLQAHLGSGDQPAASSELLEQVSLIVEKRLEELTPQMVKKIIQEMIRAHLGWLVVWGGVCGGLLGLVAGLLKV